MAGVEHAISYSRPMRILMTIVGCPPRWSRVVTGDDEVEVRMSWAFRARFPRSAVTAVHEWPAELRRPVSRGAHGWGGRWLVNGSGEGLVVITIDPPVPAHTIGFPIQLRELTVSVDDPAALVSDLQPAAG